MAIWTHVAGIVRIDCCSCDPVPAEVERLVCGALPPSWDDFGDFEFDELVAHLKGEGEPDPSWDAYVAARDAYKALPAGERVPCGSEGPLEMQWISQRETHPHHMQDMTLVISGDLRDFGAGRLGDVAAWFEALLEHIRTLPLEASLTGLRDAHPLGFIRNATLSAWSEDGGSVMLALDDGHELRRLDQEP